MWPAGRTRLRGPLASRRSILRLGLRVIFFCWGIWSRFRSHRRSRPDIRVNELRSELCRGVGMKMPGLCLRFLRCSLCLLLPLAGRSMAQNANASITYDDHTKVFRIDAADVSY